MTYETIDPVIRAWTVRHGFPLFESLQGSPEVVLRSVYLSSPIGECFQIWFGEPSLEQVTVHAADVETHLDKEFRQEWSVPLQELNAALEEAVARVHQWMNR